jgi:exodeoxyribonuclease-5
MLIERKNKFKHTVLANFGFTPTQDQQKAIDVLANFVFDVEANPLYVLRGYAGTGKTSLISAFIKTCDVYNVKAILMAPTGRAAKVLANYSGKQASTIHKRIYFRNTDKFGNNRFVLQQNMFKTAIFIVDEASMVGDLGNDLSNSLLADMLSYVYSGYHCRLIFIGDTAQLPPVGFSESPALDVEYLKSIYPLSIHQSVLRQVMRQAEDSGILFNATLLRVQLIQNPDVYPKFDLQGFKDIKRIEGTEFVDFLESSYNNFGEEGTIVITRSNKNANLYNRQIRSRIKWLDSIIEGGDYCMVVKNNYHWLDEDSKAGFIANGDVFQVLKIKTIKELYGFKFAEAHIQLIDFPDQASFDVMLLLDALDVEGPSLSDVELKKLYDRIMEDYMDESDRNKRKTLLKANPYFNALQIKFAYCVTCHKSQGGQWNDVYVDSGYLTEEMINEDYYRWLYTALTRASNTVYLVNFNDKFF